MPNEHDVRIQVGDDQWPFELRWRESGAGGFFELTDFRGGQILVRTWVGLYDKAESFDLVVDVLRRIFGVPKTERTT